MSNFNFGFGSTSTSTSAIRVVTGALSATALTVALALPVLAQNADVDNPNATTGNSPVVVNPQKTEGTTGVGNVGNNPTTCNNAGCNPNSNSGIGANSGFDPQQNPTQTTTSGSRAEASGNSTSLGPVTAKTGPATATTGPSTSTSNGGTVDPNIISKPVAKAKGGTGGTGTGGTATTGASTAAGGASTTGASTAAGGAGGSSPNNVNIKAGNSNPFNLQIPSLAPAASAVGGDEFLVENCGKKFRIAGAVVEQSRPNLLFTTGKTVRNQGERLLATVTASDVKGAIAFVESDSNSCPAPVNPVLPPQVPPVNLTVTTPVPPAQVAVPPAPSAGLVPPVQVEFQH